jgi:thiaminase (transcriptional activator TenA)
MELGFSEDAFERAAGVYKRIVSLPFIQKLKAGTLSEDVFLAYLAQDALYLAEYAFILATVAAKAPSEAEKNTLLGFSTGALLVETSLHEGYLKGKDRSGLAKSSTCAAYTAHLSDVAFLGTYGEGVAAVLPCFRLYQEVGMAIYKEMHTTNVGIDTHPYKDWIGTYADPYFEALTAQAEQIADRAYMLAYSDQQKQMHAHYALSAEFEHDFWNLDT